jgi:hypothetical protein
MSISSFFEKLSAPLKNVRWSWGSVREADGAVFLRVWQDRKIVENKKLIMKITHHAKYVEDPDNYGWKERLSHIEIIRTGAPCYLIMCRAKDVEALPREIAGWNEKEVFVGGALREMDGDTWIEIKGRIPIAKASGSQH